MKFRTRLQLLYLAINVVIWGTLECRAIDRTRIEETSLHATNADRKVTSPENAIRCTKTTTSSSGVIHGQLLGLRMMEDMESRNLPSLHITMVGLLHLKAAWNKRLLVKVGIMMRVEGDRSGNGKKLRMTDGHPGCQTDSWIAIGIGHGIN